MKQPRAVPLSMRSRRAVRHPSSLLRSPTYDRSLLEPGIVHIGLGAFHRSHQAVYLDELAEAGHLGWGIVATSLRRRASADVLNAQGRLFTVLESEGSRESARVVGSIVEAIYAPDDPAAVLDRLIDERTKLVTLTLTGDAYRPGEPVWDLLADALRRRRQARVQPFTVVSCDNLPCNGEAARAALVATAGQTDEVLARFIDTHVQFPCSMVDRITPPPSDDIHERLRQTYGVEDRCAVKAEPYRDWVIEDRFVGPRPPLEEVGVRVVGDVAPYASMKRLMLNGGHCALAYLSMLAELRSTDRAIADPMMRRFVERLLIEEVAPLISPPTGVDIEHYGRTLVRRFGNPAVRDPLTRLARRGSTKVPAYLLPSLHEALSAGAPHELLTLAVAGWLRHLRGTDLAGRPVTVDDPLAAELTALARQGGADPRPLLARQDLFGDLGRHAGFVRDVCAALAAIDRDGVHAAMYERLYGARTVAA